MLAFLDSIVVAACIALMNHDRGIMKREEKFLGLLHKAFVDEIWGPNDGHDYA